jgi:hypothetical protein
MQGFGGKPSRKEIIRIPRLGEWIILKWILEKHDEVVCTGLIWLRIGSSGEFL